jgi:hypothetical protein
MRTHSLYLTSLSTMGSDVAEGTRHGVITDADHGPALSIISWVMVVTMVLIIGLRLAVRFSTSSPGIDDILAVLAMVGHPVPTTDCAHAYSSWPLGVQLPSASLSTTDWDRKISFEICQRQSKCKR